jgi:hypothetical protein
LKDGIFYTQMMPPLLSFFFFSSSCLSPIATAQLCDEGTLFFLCSDYRKDISALFSSALAIRRTPGWTFPEERLAQKVT